MAKVTIQEIAKRLGMSRNTVAKAFQNDPCVADNTKIQIIETAVGMGYDKIDPDIVAQIIAAHQPAANKKYAILMTDFADDDFWRGIVWGIMEEIRKTSGVCFLVLVSQEEVRQNTLPRALTTEPLDGIMCLTLFAESYYHELEALHVPLVFYDRPVRLRGYINQYDTILLEGAESMYALTTDLIQRGRNRIGFLGDIHHCESLLDRYRGFQRAMEEHKLPLDTAWNLTEDPDYFYKEDTFYARLDAMNQWPDAFVCANDYIALSLMQYCKTRGIRVPEQLAITGFDNKKECMIIEPHETKYFFAPFHCMISQDAKTDVRIRHIKNRPICCDPAFGSVHLEGAPCRTGRRSIR